MRLNLKIIITQSIVIILCVTTLFFRNNQELGLKSLYMQINIQPISEISKQINTQNYIKSSKEINLDLSVIRNLNIKWFYLSSNIAPPVMYEAEFFSALYPVVYKGRWIEGNDINISEVLIINKYSNCPKGSRKNDLSLLAYCLNDS